MGRLQQSNYVISNLAFFCRGGHLVPHEPEYEDWRSDRLMAASDVLIYAGRSGGGATVALGEPLRRMKET